MQKAKLYTQSYSTILNLNQIILLLTLGQELLSVHVKMCQLWD